MRFISRYVIGVSLLFASSGFNTASALTIEELVGQLNTIFGQISQVFIYLNGRIDDIENRVVDLESASPNFGGYATAFSPDGSPKNVTVLRRFTNFGAITYSVRSRYATSTEQISINGVMTQRPFIANYAYVTTDEFGNIIDAGNYIEAPDTEDYVDIYVEESIYDAAASKTVTNDTIRESWPCSSAGGTLNCIVEVSESATGTVTDHYPWSYTRVIGNSPISVNGMTFDDYRIETRTNGNDETRIRAKGIGEVLRMTGGTPDREIIFYRANGVENGSLAGTPFDAGQPFDGVFF